MVPVSIIIPTYNRAALLVRAIHSVLRQSYRDFELIIVDDCSSDRTREIVSAICDRRIRFIRREQNGSAAAARNTGIRAAAGELVCFLDDDDEYVPEFLEKVTSAFSQAGPDVGFCWCGIEIVRDAPNGEVVTKQQVWQPGRESKRWFLLQSPGSGAGFAARRSALMHAGLFDERLMKLEDNELYYRLACGARYIVIPETLVRIHAHEGVKLTTYDGGMAAASEYVFEKHCEAIRADADLLWSYRYKLGWMQYHAGNRRRGRYHLVRALRQRPGSPKVWVAFVCMELLGRRAAGVHGAVSRVRKAVMQ